MVSFDLNAFRSNDIAYAADTLHSMKTSSNGNFFALLTLCLGNSPVNSPHKSQWSGALMFSLICALNKRLSKQSPYHSIWRRFNVSTTFAMIKATQIVGVSNSGQIEAKTKYSSIYTELFDCFVYCMQIVVFWFKFKFDIFPSVHSASKRFFLQIMARCRTRAAILSEPMIF